MKIEVGVLAMTFGAPLDNGILVEVLEESEMHAVLGQLWRVKSLGSPFHITMERLSHTAIWPGSMLRPIGDPGEHAVDETLTWKAVPLPAIQPELLEAAHG